MSYDLPSTFVSATGWGPPRTEDGLPFDIPYQPFLKGERIGKVLDWLPDRNGRGRGNRYGHPDLVIDEEEKEWTTTDYHKAQPKYRPGRYRNRGRGFGAPRGGYQPRGGGGKGSGPGGPQLGRGSGPKPKKRNDTRPDFRRRDVHRQASVEVKQSWVQSAQITIAELAIAGKDMVHETPKDTEEVLEKNGKPRIFNKPAFDALKLGKPALDVPVLNRQVDTSNVLDSETMVGFVKKYRKHDGPAFFGTDMILATLMSSQKSTVPWDIQIERVGDSYFMSCAKTSIVNKWTVNETAADAPLCEEPVGALVTEEQKNNSQPRLSEELTSVTRNFSQMILDFQKEPKMSVQPAPVPDDMEGTPADVLYLYKRWILPNNMLLCTRTYADGVLPGKSNELFRAFPLLLLGSKQAVIGGQIGAIRANEIQNNCCRLVKQLAVTILAGAHHMKVGLVSRKRPDTRKSHVLHHVEAVETRDQVQALSTHPRALWNILIRILTEIVKAKSGERNQKFVLMRDPGKPALRLYDTTNANDESDDEDDEEEEDEETESDSD